MGVTGSSGGRVVYADLLRIIATFAVIVMHVSSGGWESSSVSSMEWHVFNVYDTSVRWAVPVFVMLSGMFLLDPGKELPAGKIYKKYILRIILAIAVWGLFYRCTDIAISKYIRHKEISRNAAIVEILEIPFGTAWFHLWYLYMIIGFYVMTPIYRVFTRSAGKKEACYLLAVFAIAGICLPFVKKILLCIHPRLDLNLSVAETVNYTGYFFAGHYLSKASLSQKQRRLVFMAGTLSFVITAVGTATVSMRAGKGSELFYGNLAPFAMMEAVMVFILARSLWEGKPFSARFTDVIAKLSSCTFGIYLLHIFMIRLWDMAGFTASFISPILAVPLLSVAVFAGSLAVTLLLRKVPLCRAVM